MKKIYFLFIATLMTTFMWSQVYVDEDFSSGVLPTGWTNNDLQGNGQDWEFDNPGNITGNAPISAPFAILDSGTYGIGNEQNAALETPAFDASAATSVQLDFDYYFKSYMESAIYVEVYDGTAWVEVYTETGANSTNPAHLTLDISSGLNSATNAQVRFRYIGEWAYHWIVDNVTIQNVTCPQVSALTVDATTENSADVSWTLGSVETNWKVLYGIPGFDTSVPTDYDSIEVSTSANTTITNLASGTTYEFYVMADCGNGDESPLRGPATFTTQCSSIDDFVETFDTTAADEIPNCWNTIKANSTSEFAELNVVAYTNSVSAPNSFKFYNSGDTTAEFYLVSPELNNLADADHQLRFSFDGATILASASLEVGTMSDANDESTFTTVESVSITSDFEEYIVAYDNSYTDAYIAFKVTFTDTYANLYLDDVNWELIPDCPKPQALTVGDVTQNTADISWTAGGSETQWQIKYGTPGFDPENEGFSETVTGPPSAITLDGLDANTAYEVYIQALCSGGDQSIFAASVEFTTTCEAGTIPFSDGFENGNTEGDLLSGCWSQEDNKWLTRNQPDTYGRKARNGDWYITLQYNNDDWIFYSLELTGGTVYQLSFYARQDATIGASVMASFGTGNSEADMTTEIIPSTNVNSDNYEEFSGTFTPSSDGVYYIGIKGSVNFTPWYLTIDDISVGLAPDCPKPTALTVDEMTATTANISWTAGGSETQWQVKYGTPGFDPASEGLSETITGPPSSTLLTDLNAGTAYEFYVRSLCNSGDQSAFSGPKTFYTLSGNDNLCDAIPLTMGATSTGSAYTNVGATSETNEPNGECWYGNDEAQTTLWFTFEAPASGNVTVTISFADGTLSDSQLAVYEAPGDCADLSTLTTQVGCDEDGGDGLKAEVSIPDLTSGDTYYVQVDGYASSTGTFGLEVYDNDPLSVDNHQADYGIELYPNPAQSGTAFYVTAGQFRGQNVNVCITDLLGKTVYTTITDFNAGKIAIQPSNPLGSGVYFVNLNQDGKTVNKRVIIK